MVPEYPKGFHLYLYHHLSFSLINLFFFSAIWCTACTVHVQLVLLNCVPLVPMVSICVLMEAFFHLVFRMIVWKVYPVIRINLAPRVFNIGFCLFTYSQYLQVLAAPVIFVLLVY